MASSRYGWLVPVALVLVLTLTALGRTDFWGTDEARYAQAAREMVERGNYAHLTVNGVQYTNKPPMLMWCQVLTSRVTGEISEFEARLPSAVGGITSVLLIYVIGAILFGRRAAFWGALFLATTPVFLKEARMGRMDVLLTSFVCLSYLGFVLWDRKLAPGRLCFILFFLPLPLGILTKFTTPLFVLPPALLYLLLTGQRRRIPWLPVLIGLAITVLPLFLYANLGEFGKIVSGAVHRRPFYYHLLRLPAVSLPFALLIPGVVVLISRGRVATIERRGLTLLGLWVLVNLVVLSISGSKRSSYLDPLLPPIALATGWFLVRACAESPGRLRRWALVLPFAALAAAILAGGLTLAVLPQLVLKSGELGFSPGMVRVAGVVVALAAGTLLLLAIKGRELYAAGGTAALIAAGSLLIFGWVNPARNHARSVRPVMEVFRDRGGADAGIGVAADDSGGMPNPKWTFYAGRRVEGTFSPAEALAWLAEEEERFVYVRRRHYDDLLGAAGGSLPEGVRVEVDSTWPEVDYVLLSNRRGPGGTVRYGPD